MTKTRVIVQVALTMLVVLGISGCCGKLFGPKVGEQLQISSAPDGASVKIDGVVMGETPLTITDLEVEEGQTQTLVFSMDGYVTKEEKITWTQPQQSIATTLEVDKKERIFTVKTIPSNAKVFVDGLQKSDAPCTFSMEMKDGEDFNLLVQRKGYDDITKKVEVADETTISLKFNFKRPGGKANDDLDEVLVKAEKKWKGSCKTIASDVCTFEYQIGSSGNVTDVDKIKCNYGPITKCTKRQIKKMVFPTEGNARSDEYKWKGSN